MWIAAPRTSDISGHLFVTPISEGDNFKKSLEVSWTQACVPLKLIQCCADWFVLRNFRLTSSACEQLLLEIEEVRSTFRIQRCHSDTSKQLQQHFAALFRTCFSQRRSTEPMTREISNEAVVMNSLCIFEWVHSMFECSMLASKQFPWNTCSADSMALLRYYLYGSTLRRALTTLSRDGTRLST